MVKIFELWKKCSLEFLDCDCCYQTACMYIYLFRIGIVIYTNPSMQAEKLDKCFNLLHLIHVVNIKLGVVRSGDTGFPKILIGYLKNTSNENYMRSPELKINCLWNYVCVSSIISLFVVYLSIIHAILYFQYGWTNQIKSGMWAYFDTKMGSRLFCFLEISSNLECSKK